MANTHRPSDRSSSSISSGIDVQLVAVLAQPARDPEAQALRPVRQAEGRIEAGDDEAPAASGATISQARHRGLSGTVASALLTDDLPGC